MFDKNDPVGSMAKIMGKLFCIMANEVIEQCGEEKGSKIVKDAVWKFGENRGNEIREKVLAAGEEINFENFEKYYDLPHNNGWDGESTINADELFEVTKYCPYAAAWKELGLEKVGALYCEQDVAMLKAYMKNIKFDRPSIFTDGENASCKMSVKNLNSSNK